MTPPANGIMRTLPSRSTPAWVASLSIIPACILLTLILKYGVDMPLWDNWHYVSFFEKFSKGTLTLGDLFAQENEYRQFFPNLIFVGLGWLTKWNLRYELLVSFALASLVSFNIYRLGRLTVGGNATCRLMIYFLSNLLIFSPVQYDNWLLGMQVIYFMPIACVTTCLVIAYSKLGARAKFLSCMCLATISTFSSANGILCWLVVLPLLVWPTSRTELFNKKWLTLAWVVGLAVSAALYLNGYQEVQGHPDLSEALIHPVKASSYFLTLLGKALEPGGLVFRNNPFSAGHIITSAVTGLTLATLFVVLFFQARGDSGLTYRAAGWFMLGAYSIMTAFLVTVGRVGFGVEHALSSRYTTFTLYLPVALIHLLPLALERNVTEGRLAGKKRLLLAALFGVLVSSHFLIYLSSISQMSAFSTHLLQSKACLLFINVVPDPCLTEKVYPDLAHLKRAANGLDGLGFLRPGLIKSRRVEELAAAGAQTPPAHDGSLAAVIQESEGGYTAAGWAVLPQRGGAPADAILLTYNRAYESPVIFALAATGAQRGVIARLLLKRSPSDYSSWQKSFSIADLPAEKVIITAWAFDARTGKAFQLDGMHVIQTTLTPNGK